MIFKSTAKIKYVISTAKSNFTHKILFHYFSTITRYIFKSHKIHFSIPKHNKTIILTGQKNKIVLVLLLHKIYYNLFN